MEINEGNMINKIVETPSVFCNSKYNGVLEDENYKTRLWEISSFWGVKPY